MKKILTLLFVLCLLKAGAQTSVKAVTCGVHNYYVRVTFSGIYVPVHDITTTTCPDNSVHNDTEEGTYLECKMELFANAACTQPVSVDPRFFSFAGNFPGATGTANNPSVIYRYTCPAPMPLGITYANNYRIDLTAIHLEQCLWECAGAGYHCYPFDFGLPTTYSIIINCCYAPSILAVELINFNGQRNVGVNTLSWKLENKQDFVKLDLERSFDGIHYTVVYSTSDANVERFSDTVHLTSYYRLKLFNTNNIPGTSSIILLKNLFFIPKTFIVSPSPFKDVLNISVSTTMKLKSLFKLVSIEGKTVFQAERELQGGVNKFNFNIPPVPPGIYIMTMISDEGTLAMKVLKL